MNKTVTRILPGLSLVPSTFNANASGVQIVSLGIGVTSQEAFSAGVVPDPNVSTDYPPRGWLWAATYSIEYDRVAGTGLHWSPVRIDVDLRANRKVDRGILFLAACNANVSGNGLDVDIVGRFRCLVLTG